RPELHPSLKPANRLPIGKIARAGRDHLGFVEHAKAGAGLEQLPLAFVLRVTGAEKGALHPVAGSGGRRTRLALVAVMRKECGPKRASGVTCGRLDPQVLESAV